jgi:murein L,D-transpeptidase YcbB/YkuD
VIEGRPRKRLDMLLGALSASGREGLDPRDYDVERLSSLRSSAGKLFGQPALSGAAALDLEIAATYMFLKYGSHLTAGRVDPTDVDPYWHVQQERPDLLNALDRASDRGEVEQVLRELRPADPQYAALQDALARYRDVASRGGWPVVPANAGLKRGARDGSVVALRRRLAATGDLPSTRGEDPAFDSVVEQGLKRFQRRHGLPDDGMLGEDTLAALNVPIEARIEQILLNLERWRWLPRLLGARHVRVNVPAYRLDVVEYGRIAMTMRVVVGKPDNPTPIFSDRMTHLIFSPYWNVPERIAREETMPQIARDPAYLERNNMEVVSTSGEVLDPETVDWTSEDEFRIRQRPGAANALGYVKFMFPNEFNVYLHDTPADRLFALDERGFSHGCVRVERPVELARYVLRNRTEWTPTRIQEAMHAGVERTVNLEEPIPVHIVYGTAWVDEVGVTNFREDVYGHDRRQRALVAG